MTTDNGSSKSQAEVHNEVKHDIERSDAKQLAATLNRQLIQPIIMLNRGPQKRYPRLRIGRAENVNIEAVMNAADKGVRFGMKISEKALREKVGFVAPEDDEDTLRLPEVSPVIQPPLKPKEQTASLARSHSHGDAIEQLADDMAGDWEEVLNPAKTLIEKAAKESSSFEEFQQKLLEIASDLSMEGMAEAMAKGNFTANIAGQVDYED